MTDLKLLVIICSCGTEAVREVIDRHHVHGFTEIPELRGSGATGRHLGTRAFPGQATMIFTAVPENQAEAIVNDVRQVAGECPPGEGVKVFVMDVKEAM